jgi:hypothetical protein
MGIDQHDYPFFEGGFSYTCAAKTDTQVTQDKHPTFFVRKLKYSRRILIGSTIMRGKSKPSPLLLGRRNRKNWQKYSSSIRLSEA